MLVPSTELQNNFGKYLELCRKQQVIITKNGKKRALLMYWPHDVQNSPEDAHNSAAAEPVPAYSTEDAGDPGERDDPSPKSARPQGWVSYREFLELTGNSEQRYELIDGVVYMLAAPVFRHQAALGRLYLIMVEYLGESRDCTAVLAPFDIRLTRETLRQERETGEDDLNIVQPDLVAVCDYRKDLNAEDQYWGVPELAIEILSPSSRSKDSIKKVDLYMESGIRECWIVDPLNRTLSIHVFRDLELAETRIATAGRPAESDRFPGLVVEVERVFGQDEPAQG
ncbi:MAG: type II toxin-antitoxin system Phd/YefM family antitoxin [Spirochaeta sp.]|nr:type II toxin-antitoxin system Phd/YefM family antitoxin [Spirochaeta sp.]